MWTYRETQGDESLVQSLIEVDRWHHFLLSAATSCHSQILTERTCCLSEQRNRARDGRSPHSEKHYDNKQQNRRKLQTDWTASLFEHNMAVWAKKRDISQLSAVLPVWAPWWPWCCWVKKHWCDNMSRLKLRSADLWSERKLIRLLTPRTQSCLVVWALTVFPPKSPGFFSTFSSRCLQPFLRVCVRVVTNSNMKKKNSRRRLKHVTECSASHSLTWWPWEERWWWREDVSGVWVCSLRSVCSIMCTEWFPELFIPKPRTWDRSGPSVRYELLSLSPFGHKYVLPLSVLWGTTQQPPNDKKI